MATLFQFNDNDFLLQSLQRAANGEFINDALVTFSVGEKLVSGKVSGATNADPIVITSAGAGALLENGDQVVIVGVLGNLAANVQAAEVANKSANTFELADVAGDGDYIDPVQAAFRGDWYRIVPGTAALPMAYEASTNGHYRGLLPGTVNLEERAGLVIVVRISNYAVEFVIDATAVRRTK